MDAIKRIVNEHREAIEATMRVMDEMCQKDGRLGSQAPGLAYFHLKTLLEECPPSELLEPEKPVGAGMKCSQCSWTGCKADAIEQVAYAEPTWWSCPKCGRKCLIYDVRRLLNTFTPPEPPKEKPSPVLRWRERGSGGVRSISLRHNHRYIIYHLGPPDAATQLSAMILKERRAGECIRKGTLQECMQVCEDYEAKKPEAPKLKSGWHLYEEVGCDLQVAYIYSDGRFRLYSKDGSVGATLDHTQQMPGTFEGPFNPAT